VRRPLALALVAAVVFAVLGGCSSDPDTPLGAEFVDTILGSEPGVVFQDTIEVLADTVLAFDALLAQTDELKVGRSNGYTRSTVVRADFTNTDGDENREVTQASLRMRLKSGDEIAVRFYLLAEEYSESDSLETLDTLSTIANPVTGNADRILTFLDALQPLPIELVQGWIRGDTANTGIAIVYQDDGNERLAEFDATENGSTDADPLTIQVDFSDQTSSSYKITEDGTFVRPEATTPNLILSDGFVRRIWFRLNLDQVNDSSSVHSARITFNLVPGTGSGIDFVQLYIPASDDPSSSAFLSGTDVDGEFFGDATEQIEFPATVAVLGVLSGRLPDNGFVLRLSPENTGVRFVEFFGSGDPDLAPRMILTSSTPADFTP